MKVDQATVDAVNAVMAKTGIYAMARSGGLGPPVLDADDVSALLLALAKCEPVSVIVESANDLAEMLGCIDSLAGRVCKPTPKLARLRAALAPFTEGGAE